MKPDRSVLLFMGTFVIFGTLNALNDKFQNQQYVREASIYKSFFHPYMQATVTSLAILLAFPIFLLHKKYRPEGYLLRQEDAKSKGLQKLNPIKVSIIALCDVFSSLLQGIALNFIPASAQQMFEGGNLTTTFFFSIIFLKMKARRYQVTGVLFCFIGIIFVGLSSLLYSQQNSKNTDQAQKIVGFMFLVIGLFLDGFSYVYEEHLLRNHYIQPINLIGYEGLFGLFINIFILIAASFISCSYGPDACVITQDGSSYMERPEVYFRQLYQDPLLLGICVFEIFTILGVNMCSVLIINKSSALATSLVDTVKTGLIWVVGIVITVTIGTTQDNYRWEFTNVGSIVFQMAGFFLLLSGNLLYNQVLQPNCLIPTEEKSKEDSIDSSLLSIGQQ